jgi:hypothetical protein
MRTVLWTVFLVVALQGIASASTAVASPTVVSSSASAEFSGLRPTRVDADALKAQPSQRPDAGRKAVPSQPQVLSKNFQSPKPVQIYWFFGGR